MMDIRTEAGANGYREESGADEVKSNGRRTTAANDFKSTVPRTTAANDFRGAKIAELSNI